MYFFVCAEYPVAVKLDGNYLGSLQEGNLLLPVSSFENSFVEVCSLDGSQNGLNFILSADFVCRPPTNVYVTDLDGGYLIKLNRTYNALPFTLFTQEKFSGCACTVYAENGYKITLETPRDFYLETLDFEVTGATVRSAFGGGIIVVQFEGDNTVCAYNVKNKIEKVMCCQADYLSIENGITTKQTLNDIACHVVTADWQLKDGRLVCISRSATTKEGFYPDRLPLEILPYAFLEELAVGGSVDCYLTGNVLANKDKLKAYLGEFIGVMPPPVFKQSQSVGLIYKDGNRRYKVKYLTFQLDGRKICNLSFV